jgi:hypothetical protein
MEIVKCEHTLLPLTVFRDTRLTVHDISKNEINITMFGEWGGQEIGLPSSVRVMKKGNSVLSAQPYRNV